MGLQGVTNLRPFGHISPLAVVVVVVLLTYLLVNLGHPRINHAINAFRKDLPN